MLWRRDDMPWLSVRCTEISWQLYGIILHIPSDDWILKTRLAWQPTHFEGNLFKEAYSGMLNSELSSSIPQRIYKHMRSRTGRGIQSRLVSSSPSELSAGYYACERQKQRALSELHHRWTPVSMFWPMNGRNRNGFCTWKPPGLASCSRFDFKIIFVSRKSRTQGKMAIILVTKHLDVPFRLP